MDQQVLLQHTGMTAADVELVYDPSKDKPLALAAGQHLHNVDIPHSPLTTCSSSRCTDSATSLHSLS